MPIDIHGNQYHIWCNNVNAIGDPPFYHPKNCSMCKSLFKEYPQNNLNEIELMVKHFPDNIPISQDNPNKLTAGELAKGL